MYRGECNITHGGSKTRLYRIWKQMRIRCRCVTNPTYRYYGARGIDICQEWDDFAVFREWAYANGYADELSIDRIDGNGDYCPSNCRWIAKSNNCKFKRSTKWYTYKGRTMTHGDWAKEIGISPSSLTKRISRNGIESSLSAEKNEKHIRTVINPTMGG